VASGSSVAAMYPMFRETANAIARLQPMWPLSIALHVNAPRESNGALSLLLAADLSRSDRSDGLQVLARLYLNIARLCMSVEKSRIDQARVSAIRCEAFAMLVKSVEDLKARSEDLLIAERGFAYACLLSDDIHERRRSMAQYSNRDVEHIVRFRDLATLIVVSLAIERLPRSSQYDSFRRSIWFYQSAHFAIDSILNCNLDLSECRPTYVTIGAFRYARSCGSGGAFAPTQMSDVVRSGVIESVLARAFEDARSAQYHAKAVGFMLRWQAELQALIDKADGLGQILRSKTKKPQALAVGGAKC